MLILSFAFISAIFLYLSSPGVGFYFCAWFALVPLFIACRQTSPRKSALLGLFAGLIYYILLLKWITISLENYGYLPWWISWPALILLAGYMSLYLAFFAWLSNCCFRRFPLIWIFPAVWVSLDFLRSILFSGFPWQDLGYSQYANILLIQVADLAGHYGVTFLIVLVNTVIFSLITLFSSRRNTGKNNIRLFSPGQTISALILIAAALTYSFQQMENYQSTEVKDQLSTAVIQGSINQEEKWLEGSAEKIIKKYLDLSYQAAEEKELDLMVWPETAIPFLFPENPLMEKIIEETVGKGTYSLLTGMPYFRKNADKINYYNSALLIRPDFSLDLYLKQHLVPFGEYIPFKDILKLPGPLVQSAGNLNAGESSIPLPTDRFKLGILICFESIFPELAREEVANGAEVLVNITNDAWFGYSNAPVQHMSMAVFRAVENRRSLARAANSGISCFISPAGHLEKTTPLFEPCFINAELPVLKERTIYNRYGHFFAPVCLVFSVFILLYLFITRNPR